MGDAPPDLILCDIAMPGYSGVDLYEQLGDERPALQPRFLFITAGPLTAATREFCRAHRARVIEKPFEPEQLLAKIREHLRQNG
jgi:DNA-binding response OmpR family regulator